jgi:ABC-2 type transport system permease protein
MLKYLIEKEFIQIRRNPVLPKLMLVFPVLMMLIIPNAANMEVKNLRICAVDNDKSTYSTRLLGKLASSENLSLTSYVESHKMAINEIEDDNADIIIEIPENFEKNLVNTGNATVSVESNSVNAVKGSIGSSYIISVLNDYSGELTQEGKFDVGPVAVKGNFPIIDIVPKSRFNPKMQYKVFMVPALIVMLITILCGFIPALNIVTEKEKGTIEQINVTPVKRRYFILGKLIPYWIIGVIVLSILILLAKLFYNIYPEGSLLTFYLFAFIYIFVVSGMGLLISNYSGTMQQAMFVMYFFMLILILMSGLFTPVQSMPEWARIIAIFNPLKYFVEVVRAIYIKGSSLVSVLNELWTLIIFAAILNTWAVVSYRKKS